MNQVLKQLLNFCSVESDMLPVDCGTYHLVILHLRDVLFYRY
jgi:hypothetical protein